MIIFSSSEFVDKVLGISIGINCIFIVIDGCKYYLENDEIKEIKKYGIYLNIMEDLERYKDNPNLLNNIKNMNEIPNINTLDNYSLKEIMQLEKNLLLCKKYEIFSKQADAKLI